MTEIGSFSIVLALILSVYSGFSMVFGLRARRAEVIASAENGIKAIFFCLNIAFFACIGSYFQGTYKGRISGSTCATLHFSYTKGKIAKYSR